MKGEPNKETGGYCNTCIGYLSENHFTFNPFEISFVNNIYFRYQIILQTSRDHDIDTDWETNYGRDFARSKFRMSFGKISYIATAPRHYSDIILGEMASQITSLTIIYSTVYSGADQRKHQSSASLAFVRVIHQCGEIPAQMARNAEMLPFDDVVMFYIRRIWDSP